MGSIRRLTLLTALTALFVSFAAVAQDPQVDAVQADYREFLLRLGFRDYSAEAQRTLEANSDLGPVQRRVLQYNRDRYTIINSARELTAILMAEGLQRHTAGQQTIFLDRLAEVTSRIMALQPLQTPDEFPPEIESIRSENERNEAKKRWLDSLLRQQMQRASTDLLSDILTTLYGEETIRQSISRNDSDFLSRMRVIEGYIHDYVKATYSDPDIGQTRFLGRALAASLVRFSRLNNLPEIEAKLEAALLNKGLVLKNFVSNQWTFVDRENRARTIRIQNGDFLMENSHGREAWSMTSAIVPTGIANRIHAFLASLYGNWILAPFMPDEEKLLRKIERGERISLRERFAYYLLQLPITRRGYSHAGIAQVTHDPTSRVSMVWARDLYPNAGLGGVRFMGLESFAHDGRTQSFGVARYDARKFQQWAQRQLQTRGHQETVWQGLTLSDRNRSSDYRTSISADDFRALVERPASQASEFMKDVHSRVFSQFDQFMTGKDALGFVQGRNIYGMANCTEGIVLAYLMGTNIDPQSRMDRWSWPAQVARRLGITDASELMDPNRRAIAPSGFAWQTDLVKSHQQVFLEYRSISERYQAYFQAPDLAMNRRVTDLLRPHVTYRFDNVNLDQGIRLAQQSIEWTNGTIRFGDDGRSKIAIFRHQGDRAHSPAVSTTDATPESRPQASVEFNPNIEARREARTFLVNLGFKDYVSEMRQNLASGPDYGPLARGQLQRNIENYEVFNAARELAIEIMDRMGPRLRNSVDRRDLIELTARMLATQPFHPPSEYPTDIMSLPTERRSQALQEYLWRTRVENMETHTRRMTSDIADLIFGKQLIERTMAAGGPEATRLQADLGRIRSLVAVNIKSMYMDTQIGRTAFLGRAMAALVAREAQTRGDQTLVQDLSEAVEKRNLRLQNFIGDTVAHFDEGRNRWVERRVGNFEFVLNRGLSANSPVISGGAVPHEIGLARRLGLVGSLPAAAMFGSVEDARDGLSLWDRIKDRLPQIAALRSNDGFSHIGYSMVRSDPRTGIKMLWIVDNYPEPAADASDRMNLKTSTGGVRILGYEGYNEYNHHGRIMFASYDPVKFFRHSIQYINENGYPRDRVIFESIRPEFNAEGDLIVPREPKDMSWKIEVSPEEFREVHREIFNGEYVGKSQTEVRAIAQRWFDRVTHLGVEKLVQLTERGMYFQWITPLGQNFGGGGYCSQTGKMAFLKATGIDMQAKPDRYISILHGLVNLTESSPAIKRIVEGIIGKEQLSDFKAMSRLRPGIVAPSGLVAQPHYGDVTVYDHPNRTMSERSRAMHNSYIERNMRVTELLERLLPRTESRFNQFVTRRVLQVYRETLAGIDMEYERSQNAAHGIRDKVNTVLQVLGQKGPRTTVPEAAPRDRPSAPPPAAADPASPPRCSAVFSLAS